jgi:hypothetical protein
MIMTARRLRSMGWIATLVVCAALVMVLAFRVNALRSQVHQSQARIIALKQETMYLETEFETRASQQQLKSWNDVEFGYAAPTAVQYLDNERQLASYAKPIEPGAPAPIRVASADDSVAVAAAFPAMVSPMTGKPVTQTAQARPARAYDDSETPPVSAKGGAAVATPGLASLSDRLGTVHHDHAVSAHKAVKAKEAGARPAKGANAGTRPGKPALARAIPAHGDKAHDQKTARAHLASADTRHRAVSDQHAGSPLIKLALKDAKTVK